MDLLQREKSDRRDCPQKPRRWRRLALGLRGRGLKVSTPWRLGQRDLATAKDFVEDIAKRVKGRVQITTDQLRTYLNVVEACFRRTGRFRTVAQDLSGFR